MKSVLRFPTPDVFGRSIKRTANISTKCPNNNIAGKKNIC